MRSREERTAVGGDQKPLGLRERLIKLSLSKHPRCLGVLDLLYVSTNKHNAGPPHYSGKKGTTALKLPDQQVFSGI